MKDKHIKFFAFIFILLLPTTALAQQLNFFELKTKTFQSMKEVFSAKNSSEEFKMKIKALQLEYIKNFKDILASEQIPLDTFQNLENLILQAENRINANDVYYDACNLSRTCFLFGVATFFLFEVILPFSLYLAEIFAGAVFAFFSLSLFWAVDC